MSRVVIAARLIFYYSASMNKLSSKLILSAAFVLSTLALSFAQNVHDHSCRTEQIEVFRKFTSSEAFASKFEERFHISFSNFLIANRLYSEALEITASDSLCKPNNGHFNIENFVFNYVEFFKDNLVLEFDSKENYSTKPGKYAILKDEYGNFPITKAAGQPCTNADFEQQTFNGWETYCGKVNSSSYNIINQTLYTPGIGQSCQGAGDQHLIVLGGVDPIVPTIPMLNPNGGNATVRLGDGTNINAYGAVLRQTFLVDPNSTIFSYSYAAVLEDPSHSPMEQPFFRVRITDQNGNVINCGNYQAYAADGQFGWVDAGSYVYKNWSTTMVNLASYVGQNVTVEFLVGDCSLTGHYGYAYVEASCTPSTLQMSGSGICIGQSTTISAPANANGYFWNTGSVSQSINVTTPGTYSVTLNSLQGTSCNITLSATIPGFQSPTADFTYTTKACRIDSVSFTNTSSISSGSINTVRWNFGDNVQTPFGAPANNVINTFNTVGTYNGPYHHYGNTGSYNVTLTVISNNGCTATVTKPISVSMTPNINAGPNLNVCENTGVTLNATGAPTLTWSNNIQNGTTFYPSPGNYTYVVTGTAPNGCFGTDTVLVNVDPSPTVQGGQDQTICAGQSITLNGSGNAPSYTWNNGITNGTPFTPTATNSYIVSYTSPNGCTDRDTVLVTVQQTPVLNVVTPINTCSNNTITLNATGAHTYTWSPNAQNGVPFQLAAGTYTYTVTGATSAGCTSTATVTINVDQAPNVDAGPDKSICIGQTTSLQASGNAPSYSWNNGIINNIPFAPQASNTYIVSYTSPNGCTDSDTMNLTVNPLPTITAGTNFTTCSNQTITLQGGGGVSYVWNNGVSNGVPFLQSTQTETYTVTGTDANGCVGTSSITITTEQAPTVDAGPDFSLCPGQTQTIQAMASINPVNWLGNYQNGQTYTFTNSGFLIAWAESPNGCRTYDTLQYTVNSLPNVNAGPDLHICLPNLITLNGDGAITYTWSNNIIDGVPFSQTSNSQLYVLTGVDANGCVNTDSVWVYTYDSPVADFTANPMTGEAPLDVTFTNTSSGNILNYDWTFGNGNTSNSNSTTIQQVFGQPGNYTVQLIVSNTYCSDTASKAITVNNFPKPDFNIPNVITPNDDGVNDGFHMNLKNVKEVQIYIYNRWGQYVAELKDVNEQWYGINFNNQPVVDGVYYFIYEIIGLDDSKYTGDGFFHLFK